MEHIKETVERIEENRSLGLDGILGKVNGATGRILGKALSGEEISVGEAEELFNITDPDELSALAITADEIRKEDVGDVVTYVVNRNINFTNICNTYCGFCNFMAPEGDERAYFLSMDEIADKGRRVHAGSEFFDIVRDEFVQHFKVLAFKIPFVQALHSDGA